MGGKLSYFGAWSWKRTNGAVVRSGVMSYSKDVWQTCQSNGAEEIYTAPKMVAMLNIRFPGIRRTYVHQIRMLRPVTSSWSFMERPCLVSSVADDGNGR